MGNIKMMLTKKIINRYTKVIFFPYEYYMFKYRCIFIHIPKTAGTSILYNMGKTAGKGRQHFPYYIYRLSNPIRYKKYFKFSFVRNPWDRVYSTYRYLLAGGNQYGDKILAKSINAFESFEKFVLEGLGKGHFRNLNLFLPQSNFVLGPNAEIMVDFLGRYENLETDMKVIANKVGIDSQIPTMNKSPHLNLSDWRKAYTKNKTIEIIKEIYKQDVTVFGYNFPTI
jgi:hypothetical protein